MFSFSAEKVQLIGDSISKNIKREDIPQTEIIHTGEKEFIQLDPNDEDSKVAVPITESKLNKLKLFYYIKKTYPKFVKSFLQKSGINPNEDTTNESNDAISLDNLKAMLSKPTKALNTSNPNNSNLSMDTSSINAMVKQNISSNKTENEGEEIDEIITSVSSKKPVKLNENNLDDIMSNLIQKEMNATKNKDFQEHQDKPVNEESTTEEGYRSSSSRGDHSYDSPHLQLENNNNNNNNNDDNISPLLAASLKDMDLESSHSDAEQKVESLSRVAEQEATKCINNKQEIGCMMNELVDLFHETYTSDGKGKAVESLTKGKSIDFTGETRGGGDPYASIGHSSFRHASHAGESVRANKYYDKNIGK